MEHLIILGFLFHLIGDYLLQNDWLATYKTKDIRVAFIHALIYSLPFLAITNYTYWLVIFISHLLIDRYRLAVYWIKLVNWNWNSTNFGYDNLKPPFMSVWLMIIIDNTFHLIINSLCIFLSN